MTRVVALAAGVALLTLSALVDGVGFWRGYLVGWLLALAMAGGAAGWSMVHTLTGGCWGNAVRGPAEAAMRTMPWVALAAAPLAFAAPHVFPWADPAAVEASHAMRHRQVAFAPPWVFARSALFLCLWSLLAWRLVRTSPERRGRLAAGGLVLYFVTMSIASVDWIASREPDWYSSTFGFVTILGQAATALSLLIVASTLGRHAAARAADVTHALGNLLQTTVVLWAYVSFAQYLVIWSGNSQEDIVWFVHRTRGVWLAAGVTLIVGHFGLPFVLLLFQRAKRSPRVLAYIAAFVLAMRFVDTLWTVVPSNGVDVASPMRLSDGLAPIAVIALWWAVFDRRFVSFAAGQEARDAVAAA